MHMLCLNIKKLHLDFQAHGSQRHARTRQQFVCPQHADQTRSRHLIDLSPPSCNEKI
jgi:hypothetical protein